MRGCEECGEWGGGKNQWLDPGISLKGTIKQCFNGGLQKLGRKNRGRKGRDVLGKYDSWSSTWMGQRSC